MTLIEYFSFKHDSAGIIYFLIWNLKKTTFERFRYKLHRNYKLKDISATIS